MCNDYFSQKSYHDHFDKISSVEIYFRTVLNPNANIFIPSYDSNKATRSLNDQIHHNFADNSMLNLSPTAVLSTVVDDYRSNDSCVSTDSTNVVNLAFIYSNVENVPSYKFK